MTGHSPSDTYIQPLKSLFGERISTRESDRTVYHRDLWPGMQLDVRDGVIGTRPDAVVWPVTVQEVAALLRLANEFEFPVIPHGGGSNVVGATAPVRGGVICDMKRMARIVSLDEKSLTVCAETGINGETLEEYLNRSGYTLGHYSLSDRSSTLGGWLATRAAGYASAKYGKIEEMIVSLEAALPSGRVLHTKLVPKSATGPDIDQLLVGSEGTLGIITRATLRVLSLPQSRRYVCASFSSIEEGLEVMRRVMRMGIRPAVMRLYDETDTTVTLQPMGLSVQGNVLLMAFEGRAAMVEAEVRLAEQILAGAKLLGEAPGKEWFESRYRVAYLQSRQLSGTRMIADSCEVSATWSRVLAVYRAVKESLQGLVTVSAHFSHAYAEGVSVRFSFAGDAGKRAPQEYYEEIWRRAVEAATAAGAGISHQGGIGVLKAPWMRKELGPLMDAFLHFKRELDPKNILNPGKMGLP